MKQPKTLSKMLKLPPKEKSAKEFLIKMLPQVLALFDAPQNILGFNIENIARKQIYAMSEENARKRLDALKWMLQKW